MRNLNTTLRAFETCMQWCCQQQAHADILPLTALCWRTPFPSTAACFTHRGLVWRRFGYSSIWETADTDVCYHHSFKSRLNREYREAGCDKKVRALCLMEKKKTPTCQILKFSNWIVFLVLFFTFKRILNLWILPHSSVPDFVNMFLTVLLQTLL